jgi:hypothetical protein
MFYSIFHCIIQQSKSLRFTSNTHLQTTGSKPPIKADDNKYKDISAAANLVCSKIKLTKSLTLPWYGVSHEYISNHDSISWVSGLKACVIAKKFSDLEIMFSFFKSRTLKKQHMRRLRHVRSAIKKAITFLHTLETHIYKRTTHVPLKKFDMWVPSDPIYLNTSNILEARPSFPYSLNNVNRHNLRHFEA